MTVQKAIARAWKDPAYRSKLIDDPHTALEELGADIAPGMKINVLQDTSNHAHIVIPVAPDNHVEMAFDELEGVAGGTSGNNCALSLPIC